MYKMERKKKKRELADFQSFILEFLKGFFTASAFGNLENIESDSFTQRSAFSYCDNISNLNISENTQTIHTPIRIFKTKKILPTQREQPPLF